MPGARDAISLKPLLLLPLFGVVVLVMTCRQTPVDSGGLQWTPVDSSGVPWESSGLQWSPMGI